MPKELMPCCIQLQELCSVSLVWFEDHMWYHVTMLFPLRQYSSTATELLERCSSYHQRFNMQFSVA